MVGPWVTILALPARPSSAKTRFYIEAKLSSRKMKAHTHPQHPRRDDFGLSMVLVCFGQPSVSFPVWLWGPHCSAGRVSEDMAAHRWPRVFFISIINP